MYQFLLKNCIKIWAVLSALFSRKETEMKYIPLEELKDNLPPQKSVKDLLIEEAEKAIDKDITPNDEIQDKVSCVAQIVALLQKVMEFPDLNYTPDLLNFLKQDKRFKSTLDLDIGNIIISPTGYGNGSIVGHVGLYGTNGKIMSNNSFTGKWEYTYTTDTWVNRYRNKGGFPIYVFKLLV